jgi:hypothetical protein
LPSILSDGLKPQIGPRAKRVGEKRPLVFLFPDLETVEDALMGWLELEFGAESELALLSVQLPPEVTTIFSDIEYEMLVDQALPAEACQVLSYDVFAERSLTTLEGERRMEAAMGR